jgi:serine/threonine protein kinase
MPLAAGARLGPYEIVTLVGEGGMGEVYQARDTRLNRIVAIKVLLGRFSGDPDRRRRLELEARAIAALTHPNICTLHDVGRYEDGDFLVMEYLEGETLASRLKRGPLPINQVLRYGAQIADALDKAHRQGITHRDLKPGNIMLTKSGVKLLDFGLARGGAEESAIGTETVTISESTTRSRMVSGTLPYMAPEQLEGARGDKRTDMFALGTVLYEMAAGQRAFRGDSPTQLIAAILHQQPEALTAYHPTIPVSFERVVSKCLSKDPDARWQSASDLADELRWIATGEGALSRLRRQRVWRLAAIVVGGLLTATGAGVVVRQWRDVAGSMNEVRYRKVTSSGDVVMSAISPDGRTVAYVAGTPGGENRVILRDLEGGELSAIWTGRDVLGLTWLADGSHVVVVGTHEKQGAWVVPVLGGPAGT